jgi:hypothetical protein
MYSLKRVRVDKATMNSATNKATTSSTTNKAKRKAFVENLNKHIDAGNRIVFQDETSFNLYLSRTTGWSRVGERAVARFRHHRKPIHIQGGVSPGTGIVLLQTHEGSVKKEENTRSLATYSWQPCAPMSFKSLGRTRGSSS